MMKNTKLFNLILSSLGVALLAVCSFITIPGAVPYTLQTFALYLILTLFGAEIGMKSILIYILLGALGAPVFSGFTSGTGRLFGVTGGFILGFILIGICYLFCEKTFSRNRYAEILSLVIGTLLCYCFGTAWFMHIYAKSNGYISILTALSSCVFPFIIPDTAKMVSAILISKKLGPILSKTQKSN